MGETAFFLFSSQSKRNGDVDDDDEMTYFQFDEFRTVPFLLSFCISSSLNASNESTISLLCAIDYYFSSIFELG